MIKILTTVLFIAFSLANVKAQTKYEIPSGKVDYVVTSQTKAVEKKGAKLLPSSSKGKRILWFDQYGERKRVDYYEEGKLYQSEIYDGHTFYYVRHDERNYQKDTSAGAKDRFSAFLFRPDQTLRPEKSEKSVQSIAGKECYVFLFKGDEGTYWKYGGWKNILFLEESYFGYTTTKKIAVSIEEKKIPDSIFTPPAKYKYYDPLKVEKKYKVKSGIVEYVSSSSEDTTRYKIMYFFDDYGMKEKAIINTDNSRIDGEHIKRNNQSSFTLDEESKTYHVQDFRFDYFKEIDSTLLKDNYKKGTPVKIAGKLCDYYIPKIDKSKDALPEWLQPGDKYAGYKGVMLLNEYKSGNFAYTLKAVRFEEKPIPSDTFSLKSGYEVLPENARYYSKSGVITFSYETIKENKLYRSKLIYRYGDYGNLEKVEFIPKDTVYHFMIFSNDSLYECKPSSRTVTLVESVHLKTDFYAMQYEKTLIKAESGTLAGKNCQFYNSKFERETMKIAVWRNIVLLQDMEDNDAHTILKAVKVEDIDVPPSTFDLPKGYKRE